MATFTNIGQSTPRLEGPEKVTGSTQYTADLTLPGTLWGRCLRSPWPHARIAAIAAEDRDAAEEALLLIEVEYEELPAVYEPQDALASNAPILHPEVNSYYGLPMLLETPSNAFVRDVWGKGNVEEGFAQADLIIEGTYTVPRQHQAYLETHSCLVWIDDEGRTQIWTSSKVP
jgi:putative selenate reductase molybdopterin-binding subunit